MKIIIGGTRGSYPVSGAESCKYGGDTFALLVEGADGTQVLVDAGSGIRNLRPHLRPGGTLFFTHLHLDHLMGLPLLTAAWPKQLLSPREDLAQTLARVFSPPVWPVELPSASVSVPESPSVIGGLRLSWRPVAHPDGCVACRLDEPASGASVVVATDIEWRAMAPADQAAFAHFARDTDLLVFDAHFLPGEYEAHRGWGHSTWTDAVEAARQSSAAKVWLMHHAPGRSDDALDALGLEVARAGHATVRPAAAGESLTLPGTR